MALCLQNLRGPLGLQEILPVQVGAEAYVAAGTTVTEDVPPGALCIGRSRPRHIEGWVNKRREKKK